MYNTDDIKALQFFNKLDDAWSEHKWYTKRMNNPMDILLNKLDFGFDREDLIDNGYMLRDRFEQHFGTQASILLLNTFIPSDINNINGDSSEVTCINSECSMYNNGEPNCYTAYSTCWTDLHINLFLAQQIGGNSALKEIKEKWKFLDEKVIEYYKNNYNTDKGLYEDILYGGNTMNTFVNELGKIKTEDDISVHWVDGWMYVNDESENQAVTQTSLFDAYKFAVLINAPIFDYTATDEEVKELSEELLDLIDEDFYRINVWEYIDNISDDFKKLTGKSLDIHDKRAIVCDMTEMGDGYDITCGFGSATYIAKLLWRYIKGDSHIFNNQGRLLFKECDNPVAHKLADKYLQTDNYDLRKFAKALKETNKLQYKEPKTFKEFMNDAYALTEHCYFLGTSLLSEKKDFNFKFIVGEINWQGDWEKPIYCCMNSQTRDIWFEANNVRSAFIYDMIIPHYMCGCDFDEIKVKLTFDNIRKLIKESNIDCGGVVDAYIHCNMYGTQAKLHDGV